MFCIAAARLVASHNCQGRQASKFAGEHNGQRMGQKAVWEGIDTQYIAAHLEGTSSFAYAAMCWCIIGHKLCRMLLMTTACTGKSDIL